MWAILAAGLAVLLLVLCFAEAASFFDRAGGAIVYTRAAFGDFVGFEVGWMTWIARIASVASLSVFFARALGYLWAGANHGVGQALTILVALARADLDQRPRRQERRADRRRARDRQGDAALRPDRRRRLRDQPNRIFPVPAPERANFMKAALLVLFAYAGFENTAAPAGEFKNPKRDVPFALIVQIVIVTAVYTLVQLVALGVVPDLGVSKTPLADAAGS